jgi:hypothetical protein
MFIASLAFTAIMFQFGLLFSCLAKRSSISMVLGLFIWIIFAIVVPNASVQLATQLRPLESQEKRAGRMASIREDRANELRNVKVSFSNAIITSDERDAFGGYYAKRRDIYWLNAEQELNRLTLPIRLEYADKFWNIEQSHLNSFFAQKDFARTLSYISPISTYENAMALLAGTDLASFRDFIDQVRIHRNEVIEYIRSKTNDFSSATFFAVCTEEESTEYTRLYQHVKKAEDEQIKAKAKQALKEWERAHPVKAVPLNLQDFPWFKYRQSFVRDIRAAVPDLAALLVMNVILFAVYFTAFGRYDVR